MVSRLIIIIYNIICCFSVVGVRRELGGCWGVENQCVGRHVDIERSLLTCFAPPVRVGCISSLERANLLVIIRPAEELGYCCYARPGLPASWWSCVRGRPCVRTASSCAPATHHTYYYDEMVVVEGGRACCCYWLYCYYVLPRSRTTSF